MARGPTSDSLGSGGPGAATNVTPRLGRALSLGSPSPDSEPEHSQLPAAGPLRLGQLLDE
eukprot:1417092-Rhodomonas_salina.2